VKSKLKIAFLTSTDPNDRKSWSGIHYKMLEGLKNHFEIVDAIGPINNVFIKSLGIINRITLFIFSKRYNHRHSFFKSFLSAKIIKHRLKKQNYDFIFAPSVPAEIALLKTDIPILYTSDSSFGQLNNYYEGFTKLFDFSIKESNINQKKTIQKAAILSYSSHWAANYVNEFYKPQGKVFVNAYGANINEENINYKPKTIDKNKEIKLLFIGVEWERKGGKIIFETFLELLKNYNVKLTVCGCIPPVKHQSMTVIPFLNKNDKNDFKKFNSLMEESHFLFVPSEAECYGIVFCEASAYGVPSISRNTGGISGAVQNNINGILLEPKETFQAYVEVFKNLIENPLKYEKLSQSSRDLYLNKLNWKVWSKEISNLIINYKK